MGWLALAEREGEPLVAAYGCAREGQAVRVGLLFVAERVTETELDFRNTATQEVARLRLPANVLNMPQDGYLIDATLEAAPCE